MEKIPQHKHCSQCGKAFIGDTRFCSPECKNKGDRMLKSRKRNLVVLYVITLAILTLAVVVMAI